MDTLLSPATLDAIARWAPVAWLKLNPYAYPWLQIVHILGIALVFGTLWIVDLCILGRLRVFEPGLLARHLLPWTLVGFGLATATGLAMFAANIGDLLSNPAFVLKMGLLLVAGANAAVLHARGAIDGTSRLTRYQAGLSLLGWVGVIACGRWIGYL